MIKKIPTRRDEYEPTEQATDMQERSATAKPDYRRACKKVRSEENKTNRSNIGQTAPTGWFLAEPVHQAAKNGREKTSEDGRPKRENI